MTPLYQYNIDEHIIAFSTERGRGAINGPYSQFNVNEWCGDTLPHVTQCRTELCHRLGISADRLIMPHQVHSTKVVEVCRGTWNRLSEMLEGADAIMTDLSGICIGVNTADCVPLLFYDPVHDAIAAVHAGWRGTVKRIAVITLARMYESYGTKPEELRCWIGPSIGPEAFEVGDEVVKAFSDAKFPMNDIAVRMPRVTEPSEMRWHINLWKANAWQLERCGVKPENICPSYICSYTEHERFFSARQLSKQSGRTLTGIMKEERS